MKYLIVLFAMHLASLAHGQIQEKDLLGEWNNFMIASSGITVNLKTEEVTYTEEMKKMIEESGDDTEAVKPMIIEEAKSGPFSHMKLVFKQGLKAQWTYDEDVKEFGYTIVEENGSTYLMRTDGGKMQVALEGGVLRLIITNNVSVSFEKK